MMKKIILILLLFQSIFVFSQYALKGSLQDYNTSRVIKLASIVIDTTYFENIKNKKYITGGVSNDKGEFEFDNSTVDNVNLRLTYIGFESLIIENIELKENVITDIGSIEMLLGPILAGYSCKAGVIKKRHIKSNNEIKLRYPKNGRKIKIKRLDHYVLINYEDLKYSCNK